MIAGYKGTFRRIIWAIALVTTGLAFPTSAQFYERATAYQAATPIQVDGQLNEASWTLVAPLGPFRDNDTGEAVSTTTLTRLLWDDDYLYIAFECEDADIQATKTYRDQDLYEDDSVIITLDLIAQDENIRLDINPLNAIRDVHEKPEQDFAWDAVGIQTGVHIKGTISDAEDQDQGWTVEVAVPWRLFEPFDQSSRPLPPTNGDLWRLGLARIDRSATEGAIEIHAWSPSKIMSTSIAERYGAVLFSTETVADDRPALTLQDFQLGAMSAAVPRGNLPASGEELALKVVLKNYAIRATGAVTALLRSEHPQLAVLDSLVNIETIGGEAEVLTDAFRVQIRASYTAQTPLPMQLLLEDEVGQIWIENLDLYLDRIDDRPYTRSDVEGKKAIELIRKWRYHAGDDLSWAKPRYDDSEWEWVDPSLEHGNLPEQGWPGRGWFRMRVAIDSTLWNVPLALDHLQWGASEIYLNGRLLYSFGKVGASQNEEQLYRPLDPKSFIFDRQYDQLIAIRYSNFSIDELPLGGFALRLANLNESIGIRTDLVAENKTEQTLFAAIPMLFALLHLMLFLFYPKARENLYYAISTVFFAIFFYGNYHTDFSTNPFDFIYIRHIQDVAISLALLAALRFVYALFYQKLPRLFWIPFALLLGGNIAEFYSISSGPPFAILAGVLLLLAELFRAMLKPILARKPDTWIIGIGFLCMMVGIAHYILAGLDIFLPIIEGPTFIWGILALLASMSIYLTRTVAQTNKDRDFVQGAFGQYLSPAVVDQLIANPDMVNQLGGEERVMTAYFSDIANFSTISECLSPSELVHFINEYLSEMCAIIEEYGGTIDKFEGDAIVAFFGAPVHFDDHAERATLACLDQQKKLVELRQRWSDAGKLPPALSDLRCRWEGEGRVFAQVRMGLAAGPMVVGNMGSKNRTDYTMMGDTVNLAARFESGQKIYGTNIMVNDHIYEQVKDQVEARQLDVIQVMGKEEPVKAYEVLARKGGLSAEKQQTLYFYNQGFAAYHAFEFVEALRLFEQALEIDPQDGPSQLYADRCGEFAIEAPTDLVFRAQTK